MVPPRNNLRSAHLFGFDIIQRENEAGIMNGAWCFVRIDWWNGQPIRMNNSLTTQSERKMDDFQNSWMLECGLVGPPAFTERAPSEEWGGSGRVPFLLAEPPAPLSSTCLLPV